MECYCHRIPKYQNDMRIIREAMGYARREIVSGHREIQSERMADYDNLLGKFGTELINQCQLELNRLGDELAQMENQDNCYHESEKGDQDIL